VRSVQTLSQWQDLPAHGQSASPGYDGFLAITARFQNALEPLHRNDQDCDRRENMRHRRSYQRAEQWLPFCEQRIVVQSVSNERLRFLIDSAHKI